MTDIYIVKASVWKDDTGGIVLQNFVSDHKMTRDECDEFANDLKRVCYKDIDAEVRVNCDSRPACLVSNFINANDGR